MNLAFAAPGMLAPAMLPVELAAPPSTATALYADRGLIFADNTSYEARLAGSIAISQSVIDAIDVGGRAALTVSEIDLWNGDRALDTIVNLSAAVGRSAVLKTIAAPTPSLSDAGGALDEALTVFSGVTSAFGPPGLYAVLALGDFSDRLAVPLQPLLYGGGGGLDGTPDLEGLPKPVSLGWRFNVTPIFLGQVDLGDGALPTYQTHWREIKGHDAVRERGVAMDKVDFAPGVGQWRDWTDQGCFQLGFTPNGVVTCDVAGDAPDGAYAGSTPDVVARILTSLGPAFDIADIDALSFARVSTRLSGEIGWGIGAEQISASDALSTILGHADVFLSGTRAGKIRMSIVAPKWDGVQLTLDAGDIVSLTCEPLPASLMPVPQQIVMGSRKNWTVLSDIAGSVSATDRAALASAGGRKVAKSNAVLARTVVSKSLSYDGLYRFDSAAAFRAAQIMGWIEPGLRCFQVETDRYLNQVEIGHMARIVYPLYGLETGADFCVVGWQEKPADRRLTLTLLG